VECIVQGHATLILFLQPSADLSLVLPLMFAFAFCLTLLAVRTRLPSWGTAIPPMSVFHQHPHAVVAPALGDASDSESMSSAAGDVEPSSPLSSPLHSQRTPLVHRIEAQSSASKVDARDLRMLEVDPAAECDEGERSASLSVSPVSEARPRLCSGGDRAPGGAPSRGAPVVVSGERIEVIARPSVASRAPSLLLGGPRDALQLLPNLSHSSIKQKQYAMQQRMQLRAAAGIRSADGADAAPLATPSPPRPRASRLPEHAAL
jgi:hypothetical protein